MCAGLLEICRYRDPLSAGPTLSTGSRPTVPSFRVHGKTPLIIGGMDALTDLIPLLLTSDQLLSRGMTSQQLSRAVKSGDLIRLRSGFYVEGESRELPRHERHLLSVLAADAALGGPLFSHSSAALIHGLPDRGLKLGKVAVCEESPAARSRTTSLTTFRTVPDLAGETMTVNGLRVTSPARTVTDIALTASRDASVMVADAALKKGLVTADELEDSLARAAGRPGIKRARHAMSLVDDKSESVAETLSRLTFLDFGLPTPETQVEIFNEHGAEIARVDFLWPEYGVIGECDGFGKYFDGLSPAETREKLAKEKDRDAELIALGYRVIHWRWRDVLQPARLAARIRRVLFTGAR